MRLNPLRDHSLVALSVVVPFRGNCDVLKEVILGLGTVNQVVVIDTEFDNEKRKLCEDFKVHYLIYPRGHQYKKRNWFLLDFEAANDWILFLDADEALTEEFLNEFEKKIEKSSNALVEISYRKFFGSSILKFGIPQRKRALVRQGKGFYQLNLGSCAAESGDLDIEVHEQIETDGRVRRMDSKLIHRVDSNFLNCIKKHMDYAEYEVCRYISIKENVSPNLTFRQKLKYRLMGSLFFPFIYIFFDLVIFFGFFDRYDGLKHSFIKFIYFSAVAYKLKKIRSL